MASRRLQDESGDGRNAGGQAAPYEMQMLVYALAAETNLKCPPTELTLCFLRPGLEFHFPWNPAARDRAVEMVNRALP